MADLYFEKLLESARSAAGHSPKIKQIQLAGKTIELSFSDPCLERKLFPALAHLTKTAPSTAKALTVHIWDSQTSGIPLPTPLTERAKSLIQQGERWGTNLRSLSDEAQKLFYMPAPNEHLSAFDPTTQTAVYWARDAALIPYYERGAPLRSLFGWWLAGEGLLLTHAAAVGNKNGGALIVGKGGIGKSTSAISCLTGDRLGYVADDYLALKPPPESRVFSVYSTGKLDAHHLTSKIPGLLPMVDNANALKEEKGLFFFHLHYPEKLPLQLPLRVALLPRIYEGQEARVIKASPGQLLLGLAASTIYQSPGGGGGEPALNILTETMRQLPCYHLEIGNDLGSIAPCIEQVIAKNAYS